MFNLNKNKNLLLQIHPLIKQLGSDSPIFDVRLISFIDCNSFCVYLLDEEHECLKFTKNLHINCSNGNYKLMSVETWMVNVADCYVVHCKKFKYFLRVQVVKVLIFLNFLSKFIFICCKKLDYERRRNCFMFFS